MTVAQSGCVVEKSDNVIMCLLSDKHPEISGIRRKIP